MFKNSSATISRHLVIAFWSHFFLLSHAFNAVLDLNENDIRGDISSEIKHMKNLRYLRLSYNRFNALPPEMSELKNLTHVFLQGNRLSGDDRHIVVHNVQEEGYQFISDCGAPSDAAEPFVCANCDMCCNALGENEILSCPETLGAS